MPTILIADDNSNIQKMVTLAFKDAGIDVVAVGNGEAAVRKAPELMPDLVLADIFMPVRNGYEVCEFIKHNTRLAHVPVILLTGAFDPFDEKEAQRVGADGVLKKPFVPPDPLVALVKELLAKSAAERLVPAAVNASVESSAPVPGRATESASPAALSAPIAFEIPSNAEPEETATFKAFDFREEPSELESNGGASAFGSFLNTATEDRVEESVEIATVGPTVDESEMHSSQSHIDETESEDEPPKGYSGFSSWLSQAPVIESAASVMEEAPTTPVFSPSADLIARSWGTPRVAEAHPDEETVVEPLDRFAAAHFPVYGRKLKESEPVKTDATSFEDEPIADATTETDGSSDAHSEHEVMHATEQEIQQTTEPAVEPPIEAAMNALIKAHEETAHSETAPGYPNHLTSEDTQTIDAIRSAAMPWHSAPSAFREVEHETPTPQTEETNAHASQHDDTIDEDVPVYEAGETEHESFEAKHTEDALPAVISSSNAGSFPVPSPLAMDSRQIEEIVSRVVERMQPQVLDVITREILRPVVEALVRKQLEQK